MRFAIPFLIIFVSLAVWLILAAAVVSEESPVDPEDDPIDMPDSGPEDWLEDGGV